MVLTKICLNRFTVFNTKTEIVFSPGINVFIGENGTGKTHIMKLLYSACQAAQAKTTSITFPLKTVRVFRPNEFKISRLVSRRAGNDSSSVQVFSGKNYIKMDFNRKTKNWDAKVTNSTSWEKEYSELTSTFIPSKEILSNSKNLISAIDKGNVDFDDTYKDIISTASIDINKGPETDSIKKYLSKLQKITEGRVKVKDEEFYLLPTGSTATALEFQLVAEGLRKIALLWQLIKNGTLEKGSILFWDEPEANINPKNIPAIVDLLLDLQEDGVQIFIATHDYFLAKYLDARKKKRHEITYHALYKSEPDETIKHESENDFALLENNSILSQSIDLYKEEVKKVME